MAREIANVLSEYGIIVDKITHIVTDGGSAFCKAFKVYGKGSDNLVEDNEIDVIEGEEDIIFMRSEDGEPFYSNMIQLDQNDDIDIPGLETDVNDEIELNQNEIENDIELNEFLDEEGQQNIETVNSIKLPPHRRCLSHLLNLIAGDFEKEISESQSRSKLALYTTLNKLQKIWVLPRKSSYAKTIAKETLGCVLKQPCETRWNSKFDAMKRVYDLRPKINEYNDELKQKIQSAKNLQNMAVEDWSVMAAYLKVMEPVARALDTLQSDRDGNQGLIVPTLITMRYFLLFFF